MSQQNFFARVGGGPGSGKAERISRLITAFPGWRLVNTGEQLWSKIDQDGQPLLQPLMRRGDFAPGQLVVDSVTEIIKNDPDAKGFFVTGFPPAATHPSEGTNYIAPATLGRRRFGWT